MKLITAILLPFKVEEVREALLTIGLNGRVVRIRTGEIDIDAL